MELNYLLTNDLSISIYQQISSLPIADYHCHLSPEEIYKDRQFTDIGEIFLAHDHYKWRLMRNAGIDEKFITGNASYHDKFIKFASAVEFAAGNPLYHWTHMELSLYFGINTPLCQNSAEKVNQKSKCFIHCHNRRYLRHT